jgi:uroporphyrinogen decarboxylase
MFREDVQQKVCQRYGSMDTFYERLNIDVHMAITPPPCRKNIDYEEEKMNMGYRDIKPEHWLDPDDPIIYGEIEELLEKYGKEKSIFAHVWGCVEAVYGFLGVEGTLLLMASEPEIAKSLFNKVESFSTAVVRNLISMGVDVIHITGDVGSNNSMLFSPGMWRELIKPFDENIIAPALDANIPVSLHSCGYCMPLLPEWISMGVKVVHPIQESAGMNLTEVKDKFGRQLTIHGGLDIRTLSTMRMHEVEDYVKPRMLALKKGGGFIFNTAHTVQMDTSLEVLERAYDTALEYAQY